MKHTKRSRVAALTMVVAMTVAACAGNDATTDVTEDGTEAETVAAPDPEASCNYDEPHTINFTLNWFPLGDHAAYYVALEKGYYEERGLNVNILQGAGSGESVRRVGVGQADLGIADSGVIINAIRGDADLKIVAMVWDEASLAVHARRDSGINEFKDLEGKTIGAPAGDAGRIFFPDIAEANGLDNDSIEYVDIQAAAKYGALGSGQVDAIFDATTGRPLVAEAVGDENLVTFKMADYGFNMYGHAIFTSGATLECPEFVERFLDASFQAWAEVFQDPQAALEILQTYQPHIDLDQYSENLALVLDLMTTERYESGGIGWIDPDKMATTVELVNTTNDGPPPADPEEVYTNEYQTRHDLP